MTDLFTLSFLFRVDFANEDSLIRSIRNDTIGKNPKIPSTCRNYENLTVTVYGPNTTRTRIDLKR